MTNSAVATPCAGAFVHDTTAGIHRGVDTPAASPLTPEHHAQIAHAQQQRKKINRALKIAAFNAWSFAIFAGFSFFVALITLSLPLAALALAGLAWNEFRGRRQLRQLDPRGPKTLGSNQLICCALIALYCGLQIFSALTGPSRYAQAIEQTPELAPTLEPMQDLLQTATVAGYGLFFIIGVAAQGATACYYFSRKRGLEDYLQQTPDWVIDLDRARSAAAA